MRARTFTPMILLLCLLASGCTAAPVAAPPPSPQPTVTVIVTQTPTPVPESAEEIVLMMDQLLYTHDGVTDTISFMDGAGVLALFKELTGELPEGVRGTEWYSEGYITYDWTEAVSVGMAADDQTYAWVTVRAPEVGGVPVHTYEGITVGMTRDEALKTGAREGREAMEGIPATMEVGRQEVPGAKSYDNGGVGILFMSLTMEGDTIRGMSTSGNDFRDI